jgi:hypothetical protein
LQNLRILEKTSLFQIKMTNIGMQLHIYGSRCIFRKDKKIEEANLDLRQRKGVRRAATPQPNQSAGRRA